MRTLLTPLVVAAVSMLGPVGQAASSLNVTLGPLSSDGTVVWGDYLSGSWTVAANDSTFQNVSQFAAQADTAAQAVVTGADAGATALTQEGTATASAFATTGPGSSAAYAYAEQTIWFRAASDIDPQFHVDYGITQLLSSALQETAFADATVGLSLYREGGTLATADDDTLVDESILYRWNFVDSGDSWSEHTDDTLFVSGPFLSQELGYVRLRVDGQAVTAITPVPSGFLLGAIGTGLVGFLRRRLA
jgi:hypothetical protein